MGRHGSELLPAVSSGHGCYLTPELYPQAVNYIRGEKHAHPEKKIILAAFAVTEQSLFFFLVLSFLFKFDHYYE